MVRCYGIIDTRKKKSTQISEKMNYGYIKLYNSGSIKRVNLVLTGRQYKKIICNKKITDLFYKIIKVINEEFMLEDLGYIYPNSGRSALRKKAIIQKGEFNIIVDDNNNNNGEVIEKNKTI